MTRHAEISVEEMVRKRRSILFKALVYGAIWLVTRIVNDSTHNSRLLPGVWLVVLLIIQFGSAIGWGASIFRLSKYSKRLKQNPAIVEALGDEFYQQARLKALAFACGGAMFCQVMLIAVSLFHPLTAQVGADITIFVTYTTLLASFLWMERD